jgi:tryptophan synthase alpha chain
MTERSLIHTGSGRIKNVFCDRKALIGFLVAGDPSPEKTVEYALSMLTHGVDILEIGIPFSDPIAEGEVIQRANARALHACVTVKDVFGIVCQIRKRSLAPLILLTYMNPILNCGVNSFFSRCRQSGVDGVIIPDLPFEERDEIRIQAKESNTAIISLVAPTSLKRIGIITKEAEGFVYVVSSLGVTGMREAITTDLEPMIAEIRKTSTAPVAVGFGISDARQAASIAEICDGVIVGSAFVRLIEQHANHAADSITSFSGEIRDALDRFVSAKIL